MTPNPQHCQECTCADFGHRRCRAAPGRVIELTRREQGHLPDGCPIPSAEHPRKRKVPKKAWEPARKKLRRAIEQGAPEDEIRNLTWQAYPEKEPLITAPTASTKRENRGNPHEPDADERWMPDLVGAYADMHPGEDY